MERNKKTKNIISQYWNGEIPLLKSFWIVAVVLLSIASIPSYIIDDQIISRMSDEMAILILVWTVLFYLFLIYTYVGLWRSSSKYIDERKKSKRSVLWGYATYAVIVVATLSGISQVILSLAD